MSNIKVHYAPALFTINNNTYGDIDLCRQSQIIPKTDVYMTCPVCVHKYNRTFIGYAPIDIEVFFDKKNRMVIVDDGLETFVECTEEYIDSPNVTIQFYFPRYMLWTQDEDVWVEFNDHPMTSYTNNCIAVNGWFNLSNWPRCTNFAVTIVDTNKPIKISKGDPLFRLTFHHKNLNTGIVLKKETNLDNINMVWNKINENKLLVLEQSDNTNNSISNILRKTLFSATEKKCPFRFLFPSKD